MNSIILDTETHDMNGVPIQISYIPCGFVDEPAGIEGEQPSKRFTFDLSSMFDELFNTGGQPIGFGSMAVHHIIEDDLVGKPNYTTFRLPASVIYVIGHNIDYDLAALLKAGVNCNHIKPICTLKLARHFYPNESSHKLGALTYRFAKDKSKAREMLKNAHDAAVDIHLTALLLQKIIVEQNIQSIEQLYELSNEASMPKYIHFGKHKGTALVNLPDDYVNWLLSKDDLDQNLRTALLNRKGNKVKA